MNYEELVDFIKGKNYVISDYVFKNYRNLDITSDEFIFLIYFINNDRIEFDVTAIALALNVDVMVVLEHINSLINKKIITIIVGKENNKISNEYISLDLFYNKLALSFSKKKEVKSDIYSIFEKEFGRLITPTEFEIIGSWLENEFREDLILEALKESVYNGVRNLKYIDKILYNWKSDGISKVEDLSKDKKKEDLEEPLDLFDYDWFG